MATTTVGVSTVVHSGKQDAGHLETFATGMDLEDKFTTTSLQRWDVFQLGFVWMKSTLGYELREIGDHSCQSYLSESAVKPSSS
eukprot:5959432-Amphidinium_carterae.2